MPRKTAIRRLLELLSGAQLRGIASWRDLPRGGDKAALIDRITLDAGRDLGELLRRDGGPWTRDDWNDFIEQVLGGKRRRSWEEIRQEVESCLEGPHATDCADLPSELEAWKQRGDLEAVARFESPAAIETVARVCRDEALCEILARILETTPGRLRRFLDRYHGNTQIGNVWLELLDRFLPKISAPSVPASAVTARTRSPERRTPRVSGPEPQSSSILPERTVELPEPPLGHALGKRYVVVKVLGRGGFGRAYEVLDQRIPGLPPFVAKLPATNKSSDTITHELRRTLPLSHENICRCHQIAFDDEFGAFLVMEHGGKSLADRYYRRGAELETAIHLFEQAAAGLDYLHEHDVVHGDVSPSNILLDDRGRVRLTDFGIANQLAEAAVTHGITRLASIRGLNEAFASPEVRRGVHLRRASDQYSLATSFCAVLMGVGRYYDEPRHHFDRMRRGQQRALDRALLPDPGRRFRSCSEFIQALRETS